MRLDLWDTFRTRDGKSELRYEFWLIPEGEEAVKIEGEDFYPSPLSAIDSDETAAALLCFMAHYGESFHYAETVSRDASELPEDLTYAQLEILSAARDEITSWEMELEEGEPPTDKTVAQAAQDIALSLARDLDSTEGWEVPNYPQCLSESGNAPGGWTFEAKREDGVYVNVEITGGPWENDGACD